MRTAENTSAHDRCESHSESQTEGVLLTFALWCRSALCCSTSSLIKSKWPFSADTSTAVQPRCEHEIDTYTISPCLYVTYYTFHSTSISVDQTPQWFLLHCSISIIQADFNDSGHFRYCRWTCEGAHSQSPLHPKGSHTHCGASALPQRVQSELLATKQWSPTIYTCAMKRRNIGLD